MPSLSTLIVDDSAAMRKILTRMLSSLGFDAREATNGRDALGVLDGMTDSPDLVLCDWNMPEMDGLELVRAVRADHRFDGARVVMVTSEAELEKLSEALQAGADEYVMKPFTKEVLVEKLILLGLAVEEPAP
jgi:two-component system chemotaxis response regulator CheY